MLGVRVARVKHRGRRTCAVQRVWVAGAHRLLRELGRAWVPGRIRLRRRRRGVGLRGVLRWRGNAGLCAVSERWRCVQAVRHGRDLGEWLCCAGCSSMLHSSPGSIQLLFLVPHHATHSLATTAVSALANGRSTPSARCTFKVYTGAPQRRCGLSCCRRSQCLLGAPGSVISAQTRRTLQRVCW